MRYTPTEIGAMSPEEVKELVYELQVHQIELEMRNEEMAEVEAETARARDRYHALYRQAPVGYLTLGMDLVIRDVNRQVLSMLGVDRKTILGNRLERYATDEDRDACYVCLRGVAGSGEPRTAEIAFYRKGTAPMVARLNVAYLPPGDQQDDQLLVTLSDITAEHRTQKALQASEQRYGFLYEQSQALNVVVSFHGTILDINKKGLAALGYTKAEVLGRSPTDFVVEEEREEFQSRLRSIIAGDQPRGMDFRIKARDGSPHTYMSTPASVIIYEKSEPVGILFNATDVTGRKQAEAHLEARARELELANKELETFAYSVSHDLRNPLNNILALSEVLNDLYADSLDADGRKCVRQVLKSSERMSETISDLLRLSRVTRKDPEIQVVNLSEMAAGIVADLRKENPRGEVHIIIQENVQAAADKGLIHNALYNLLENAWKYTLDRENPRIEFGLTKRDDQPVYYVRDNGEGFDMKYAHKLFEPFRRLDTRKKIQGTGIGLSLVQRIIARHNGNVWAESEKGTGTTLYFTLRA